MVWSNVALSPLRVPRGGQPGGTACRGHPCLIWSRHHYWCEGPGPAQGLHVCGRSVQGAAGTERLISYAILPFERQSSAVSSRSRRCGEGGSPCAWNQSCARSLFSRVSVLMYASKPPAVSTPSSCATTTTRQPCRAGPDPAPCGHLRVPGSHHLPELPRVLQSRFGGCQLTCVTTGSGVVLGDGVDAGDVGRRWPQVPAAHGGGW